MEDLMLKYPGYFGAKLECSLLSDVPGEFWVITACDPNGLPLDPAKNEERTAALAEELVSSGFPHFSVTGYDPRPGECHREPGYGICCEEAEALRIARRWEQIAVYHIKDGMVFLVFCSERQERFLLPPWDEMSTNDDKKFRLHETS